MSKVGFVEIIWRCIVVSVSITTVSMTALNELESQMRAVGARGKQLKCDFVWAGLKLASPFCQTRAVGGA